MIGYLTILKHSLRPWTTVHFTTPVQTLLGVGREGVPQGGRHSFDVGTPSQPRSILEVSAGVGVRTTPHPESEWVDDVVVVTPPSTRSSTSSEPSSVATPDCHSLPGRERTGEITGDRRDRNTPRPPSPPGSSRNERK